MLIFYLAVLIVGLYYVIKILGPEMRQPTSPDEGASDDLPLISDSNSPENRIEKLEILLAEKNKNITFLQKELQVIQAQARDFEKIKTMQVEEMRRLKEQNRIFRSELGLPTIQVKENSIT